jgi:hypothetical protein
LPPGEPPLAAGAAKRAWLDEVEWDASGDRRLLDAGAWGAVALDRRPRLEPTCTWRTVAITPVDGIDDAVARLTAWRGWLQNAGLLLARADRAEAVERLARLGCSCITVPGAMPFPSMRWHHDGLRNLAALVRFCDVEGAAETPLTEPLFDGRP